MADRVITIEIGKKITKVCETDYKGGPGIYNYFNFETPDGMVENQIVQENETFRDTLEELLRRHNIRTRKVVFIISTIGIGTKEEVIPNMKDARIQEFVKTNLSNYFPVDPKDCHVAYRVNGVTPDGKNRLQLYAVNNNIVYAYQTLALYCKLDLVDMEFSENGVAQALRTNYPKGNVVNVNVEDDHTAITIIRDGEVALQRSVAYGLGDSIRVIREGTVFGEGLSYQEALERMEEMDCIYHSYGEMMEDSKNNSTMVDATEGLRYVVSNVSRILEYYQSQNLGISFDRIILSGIGSACKGLPELLQAETGYAFLLVDDILVGRVAKNIDDSTKSIAFTAIVSAATQKGLIPKNKKLDLEKLFLEPDDNSTARKVFAVCVIICIILVVVPVVRRIVLNGQKVSLEASIASMQEAKKVNDVYQSIKIKYDELTAMCQQTNTPNDKLLDLINEMEGGIPTDAVVQEMTASPESVTLAFTVPNKSVAAKTLQAFRGFASVENVSTDAMESVESGEDGTATYRFIITCYYPGTMEETQLVGQTEDEMTAAEKNTKDTEDKAEEGAQ